MAYDSLIRLRQLNNSELSGYIMSLITHYVTTGNITGQIVTGELEGLFYPLNENPSGYLVPSSLSNYATKQDVTGNNTTLLTYVGANYYPRTNPSGYIGSSQTGNFLTKGTNEFSSAQSFSIKDSANDRNVFNFIGDTEVSLRGLYNDSLIYLCDPATSQAYISGFSKVYGDALYSNGNLVLTQQDLTGILSVPNIVYTTGDQNITGVKHFYSNDLSGFRIGNGLQQLLVADTWNNSLGIGGNPNSVYKLDVNGRGIFRGGLRISGGEHYFIGTEQEIYTDAQGRMSIGGTESDVGFGFSVQNTGASFDSGHFYNGASFNKKPLLEVSKITYNGKDILDTRYGYLYNPYNGVEVMRWGNTFQINDAISGITSFDGTDRFLMDSSEIISVQWQNRLLNDTSESPSIDWRNKRLYGNWIIDSGYIGTPTFSGDVHIISGDIYGLNYLFGNYAAPIADFQNGYLFNPTNGQATIAFGNEIVIFDDAERVSLDAINRQLKDSNEDIAIDWETKVFGGNWFIPNYVNTTGTQSIDGNKTFIGNISFNGNSVADVKTLNYNSIIWDIQNNSIYSTLYGETINFDAGYLWQNGTLSMDWLERILYSSAGSEVLNWQTKELSSGWTITGYRIATTADLFGISGGGGTGIVAGDYLSSGDNLFLAGDFFNIYDAPNGITVFDYVTDDKFVLTAPRGDAKISFYDPLAFGPYITGFRDIYADNIYLSGLRVLNLNDLVGLSGGGSGIVYNFQGTGGIQVISSGDNVIIDGAALALSSDLEASGQLLLNAVSSGSVSGSGEYYPLNENPSGYIQMNTLLQVSGALQSQINGFGFIVGFCC